MGIETATAQGIKTAFEVFTDTLAYDVAYRCAGLDDETAKVEEKLEYPHIVITASPNWPTHHKSTFRHVPVDFRWATHAKDDPKEAVLYAIYDGCRALLDANPDGITVSGMNVVGIIIEQGGDSDVEDHEQYITLPITMKLCGA